MNHTPTHSKFDLASLFATILVFAVLFAAHSWLQFNAVGAGLIAGLFGTVLLLEWLFGKKHARIAAFLGGGIYSLILFTYLTVSFNLKFGYRYNWTSVFWDVQRIAFFVVFGAIAGYLAGLFMSGVQLFARMLRGFSLGKSVENGESNGIDQPLPKSPSPLE